MQRGRLLILVGLLLLLGTAALFFVLNRNSASQGAPTPAANVPPTQVNLTKIVIAVQPLPRGIAIPAEAVTLANWPANNLFEGVITDTAQVVGKLARYDISQGQPILTTLIAPDAGTLSSTGSEAALRIPKERSPCPSP
jgi:Flp pilus assembly protein CpaB